MDGAINVAVDQLTARAAASIPAKDTPVLLYCLSGSRSAAARRTLQGLGYTCVHNVGSLMRARRHLVRT